MPDWVTLSKFLPQLIYPFSFALLLLLLGIGFILFGRRWKGLLAVFISFVILVVAGSPISKSLYAKHERSFPVTPVESSPQGGAIVVLGGDMGIPSPPRVTGQLNGNRLIHAYRLYQAGKAPVILISGGNVFPQKSLEPEAVYSRRLLEEFGVPSAAILVESDSRNTHENAVRTRKILGAIGIDQILLVTSGFHMKRAVLSFEKSGFDVIPAPSGISVVDYAQPRFLDWWPSLGNLKKAQILIHEKIGLIVYRIRGWTD
ncbi:YdcF family protein [Arenicellales bacterium IMCC57338]